MKTENPKITDLTDEEINVLIAEHLGWQNIRHTTVLKNRMMRTGVFGNPPSLAAGGFVRNELIPTFTADLNAVHEAEKTLDAQDKGWSSSTKDYPTVMYAHHLSEIVGAEMRKITVAGEPAMSTYVYATPFEQIKLVRATAKQRACAFLIAVGRAVQ